MAGLDIVLASLHDAAGQPPDRLLARYLGAMAHPLISIVTHPANRTPGRANGYDLEWDRFFAAARDTGTAVEVDGAPGHLDLDGHLARQAVETGATVVDRQRRPLRRAVRPPDADGRRHRGRAAASRRGTC